MASPAVECHREGVEEQIGKPDARQMMRICGLRREDDPLGGDTRLDGGLNQTVVHGVVGSQQPETPPGVAWRMVIQRAKHASLVFCMLLKQA